MKRSELTPTIATETASPSVSDYFSKFAEFGSRSADNCSVWFDWKVWAVETHTGRNPYLFAFLFDPHRPNHVICKSRTPQKGIQPFPFGVRIGYN